LKKRTGRETLESASRARVVGSNGEIGFGAITLNKPIRGRIDLKGRILRRYLGILHYN
jgi:hypothetical protein